MIVCFLQPQQLLRAASFLVQPERAGSLSALYAMSVQCTVAPGWTRGQNFY